MHLDTLKDCVRALRVADLSVGWPINYYNQVDNAEHVLVSSGTGVPTSALILAPED